MDFENFLNEKLADDLTSDQLDYYWKAISLFNSWKRNQKNSQKLKNMLAYILSEFNLDDRARAKILNLKNTVATFIETGDLVVSPIKSREPKDEKPEEKQEVQIDESDYQIIEIDKEFCEKAFDKFNQKYFNGVLKPIKIELKPLSNLCGSFEFSTDFSTKSFIPLTIKLNSAEEWTLSSFRNTLVHEMLHYFVHCYNSGLTENDWECALYAYFRNQKKKMKSILEISDSTCHGGNWLKFAKELNKKYSELSITRNTFQNSYADKDKMKIINQLKEAYAVEMLFMGSSKYPRYRIVNKNQLDEIIYYIKNNPKLKRTKEGYFDKTDKDTNFILEYSLSYYTKNTFTEVRVAPILNPVSIASFPIRDLNEEPYSVGKDEWKQMNHTQAFGKFKMIGSITVDLEEQNENTETPTFTNWLNEKTTKKWDIEKLREMGLTEEEIEKLLSGEVEDTCTIT